MYLLNAHEIPDIAYNPNLQMVFATSIYMCVDHVPMADPMRGIYLSTPVETMHIF